MKKIICLYCAVIILIFCGCGTQAQVILDNDNYAILEQNGVYTMDFHKYFNTGSGGFSGARPSSSIEFSSLGRMKKAIETGSFSEQQLKAIQRTFTKVGGNVEVCNINALLDVTLPAGMTVSTIRWCGKYYSFSLSDGTVSGYLDYTDQEGKDAHASMYASRDEGNNSIAIISTGTEQERNANIVVFKIVYSGETWKEISYTYSGGEKTISVVEQYHCSVSETVPYSVAVWGDVSGEYFAGFFTGFTERPSYEWVTSFGLKPYVETETE